MATLETVEDYIEAARVLLQDTVVEYRHPDADLLLGLNVGILEARKLRSDLFIGQSSLPSYDTVDSTEVEIDEQYRLPLVYHIVGFVQLKDDEGDADQRAGAFISAFRSLLVGSQ